MPQAQKALKRTKNTQKNRSQRHQESQNCKKTIQKSPRQRIRAVFQRFPSIVGVFGLSQSNTLLALNAYAASPLFNPILIVSILFLVAGVFPYGKLPIGLSILGGIGIYISMNFYMREWLFTLSFAFVALAYFFALRQTKAPQLKTALILISVVIILGVIDIGRTAFSSPNPRNNNVPQQQAPPSMMQMQ